MIDRLKKKMGEATWLNWLEIVFHPLLLPFALVPAWTKSLWSSRILLWGQWSRYHAFSATNSINNMFYRTQWININRYGRLADSPILGLGKFPLSNFWHLSTISSYFYSYAGAVTTLLSTLFLVFTHLIWLQSTSWVWVIVVVGVFFFSSTTYATAFSLQNYQILSWMFLPMALYCLVSESWFYGAILFGVIATLGITGYAVSIYLILVYAVFATGFNYNYLWLAIFPALGVAVNFLPLFIRGSMIDSFVNVGKLIGLVRTKVVYKRSSMRFSLLNAYFFMLYSAGVSIVWFGQQEPPVFLISACILFFSNQLAIRFADEASVILVVSMSAVLEALLVPFNWLVLIGLVLVVNPALKALQAGLYTAAANFAPFDTDPMLSKVRSFLDVPAGERVYFAFDDPKGIYERLFDGYRILLEAALVIAAEKSVHLFPDFYAVSETNYTGAPPIWGRSIEEITVNTDIWNAKYVIIYQDVDSVLPSFWMEHFQVVSELDWRELLSEEDLRSVVQLDADVPQWFLLEKRVC